MNTVGGAADSRDPFAELDLALAAVRAYSRQLAREVERKAPDPLRIEHLLECREMLSGRVGRLLAETSAILDHPGKTLGSASVLDGGSR